ncbi:hypothetical protein BOX15_Mlig020102g1 [Macrostomum lignano]|uniref:Cilia- and flagella-associated protein 97 n=1 Tax=Macrostomum lignano TaxID=282301 RepID=A0A267F424_9PLAT|nr:hypothetical protein BOX15_Mlig020102g1 [Macrostomum lignano]
MSHRRPSYDDEELKGSVDFDFFSDGPESSRKPENDAQASARSAGSRRSPSNNLDDSNRQSPSPTPRQVKKAKDSPENSSPERSPRHLSRSPSPPTSRRRSRSRDSRSGSDRDQDEDETKRSSSPRRRQIRSRSASKSSRSHSSSSGRNRKRGSSRSRSNSSSASDVTDVSPLSSPRGHDSPRAAAMGDAADLSARKPPRVAAGHQGGAEDCDEDRINMETIVRALVELDKRRGQSAGPQRSGLHSGTQSMSRIHDIEAENQRLLYNLMRTKNRAKKPNNIDPPVKRPHHSTVNRQKEQRRIEEENRKIFQRLKRIRPTRGMSRDEMISDYKRQASFGLPLSLLGEESNYRQPRITQNPYCQPVSRVHSSTSIVRPGSAAAGGVSASSRPSSAASRASARGSATRTRGGGQRGGGGAGVSSGRPGWPAGW